MKIITLSALMLLAISCTTPSKYNEPSGKRLRDIVAEKYADTDLLIGGTTGAWALDSITGLILDQEFSYVTPENDFKHRIIRGDSLEWNWQKSDPWINHIQENNQVLRIHGPISPQCAYWTRDDSVSISQLETELKVFMKRLCQRYNGVEGVIMLDVVNETVHKGEWKKDEPGIGDWELPWYRIGQDTDSLQTPLYIYQAFEVATEYAPDMNLIYNQHENPEEIDSWNMIKYTVDNLRKKGYRVDGVGWQAHVDDGWATDENLNYLRDLIDWSFENELGFHVTEFSVWSDSTNVGHTLETHAETYARVLEVIIEKHKEGEVTWNTWNLDDGNAWHANRKPTMFDENYQPKPAYYAVQKVLEGN